MGEASRASVGKFIALLLWVEKRSGRTFVDERSRRGVLRYILLVVRGVRGEGWRDLRCTTRNLPSGC